MEPTPFSAFEVEGWDRVADRYDSFLGLITAAAADTLLDRVGVRRKKVLDVGCGTGALALAASGRGAFVEAMDAAPAMVRAAAAQGIRAVQATAESLPYPDETFDVVAANLVLSHLELPAAALAEWRRVSRPGGMILASTWDVPGRAALFGVFLEAVRASGVTSAAELPAGPDAFEFADPHSLESIFLNAGLEGVSIERASWVHPIGGGDALWDGMLETTVRLAATIQRQPPEIRNRIRAEFDELMAGPVTGIDCSIVLATARRPTT
jgi:SAM-dependent methyltransferase